MTTRDWPRLVRRQAMARLNMALGRCAVKRRRNRREAGKSLGDDPVAVRLKHVRGDVPALRQRNDAALGLLPCEYAELAKGAQENVPQHSDASPSPTNGRQTPWSLEATNGGESD